MQIRMASLLKGAQEAEGATIIIDSFRGFTVTAVAFSRGAEKIIAVDEFEVDRALDMRNRGVADLCMGEVGSMRPPGFDLGNSPYEVSQADLNGKTLVQSNTAGIVGVVAARGAQSLYAGSLINADATVRAVLRENPDVVSIVAMGAAGKARTDADEQCALYIRNRLVGRQPDHDAVRSLIRAGGVSPEIHKGIEAPHMYPQDVEMVLDIDALPFAIKFSRDEHGMLVARREDV